MKHIRLFIFLILVVALTACPGTQPNNDAAIRSFSGTALNAQGAAYNLGAGDIMLRTNDGQSIKVGSIAADGKFNVTLPETFTDTQLSKSQVDNPNCKGIVKEGKDALTISSAMLWVQKDNKPVGSLVEMTSPNKGVITTISRTFFNKKAVAKGICQFEEGTSTVSIDADMTAIAGWNLFTIEIETKPNGQGTILNNRIRNAASVPDGVKFFVTSN